MRLLVIALAALGTVATTVAEAQYYPPPGYYYDGPPPPRYYNRRPPGYYGRPDYYAPGPGYYGDSRVPLGAPVRTNRADPGAEPWRPRLDPRNGGLYCVQAGFTVQDGVCKPGRPY